jgi:hypothetical protein
MSTRAKGLAAAAADATAVVVGPPDVGAAAGAAAGAVAVPGPPAAPDRAREALRYRIVALGARAAALRCVDVAPAEAFRLAFAETAARDLAAIFGAPGAALPGGPVDHNDAHLGLLAAAESAVAGDLRAASPEAALAAAAAAAAAAPATAAEARGKVLAASSAISSLGSVALREAAVTARDHTAVENFLHAFHRAAEDRDAALAAGGQAGMTPAERLVALKQAAGEGCLDLADLGSEEAFVSALLQKIGHRPGDLAAHLDYAKSFRIELPLLPCVARLRRSLFWRAKLLHPDVRPSEAVLVTLVVNSLHARASDASHAMLTGLVLAVRADPLWSTLELALEQLVTDRLAFVAAPVVAAAATPFPIPSAPQGAQGARGGKGQEKPNKKKPASEQELEQRPCSWCRLKHGRYECKLPRPASSQCLTCLQPGHRSGQGLCVGTTTQHEAARAAFLARCITPGSQCAAVETAGGSVGRADRHASWRSPPPAAAGGAPLFLQAELNGTPVLALADSGSRLSYVSAQLADRAGLVRLPPGNEPTIYSLSGQALAPTAVAVAPLRLRHHEPVGLGEARPTAVQVLDCAPLDLLLGTETLASFQVALDVASGSATAAAAPGRGGRTRVATAATPSCPAPVSFVSENRWAPLDLERDEGEVIDAADDGEADPLPHEPPPAAPPARRGGPTEPGRAVDRPGQQAAADRRAVPELVRAAGGSEQLVREVQTQLASAQLQRAAYWPGYGPAPEYGAGFAKPMPGKAAEPDAAFVAWAESVAAKAAVPDALRQQLLGHLLEFHAVFEETLAGGLLNTELARVRLKDNPPELPRPRACGRVPDAYRDAAMAELGTWLKEGVVFELSADEVAALSSWAPAFVLTSGAKPRIIVDPSKGLNLASVPDHYPAKATTAVIEGVLAGAGAGGAEAAPRIFTQVDGRSSYLQYPVDPRDWHLLAFQLDGKFYAFKRLPLGWNVSPAVFQRFADRLADGLNVGAGPDDPLAYAYLDDSLASNTDSTKHVAWIRRLLARVSFFGYRLSRHKCHFAVHSIKALGLALEDDWHGLSAEHVEAAMGLIVRPIPHDLSSFIGLLNFFGPYVPNLQHLLRRLQLLLVKPEGGGSVAKQVRDGWSPDLEADVLRAKEACARALTLHRFEGDRSVTLYCDASDRGVGAILLQPLEATMELVQDPARLRPVTCVSAALNAAQRNYSCTDRESLAVQLALRKFRHRLLGRKVLVMTDHKPIAQGGEPSTWSSRRVRWLETCSEFDLEFRHVRGVDNGAADALSRLVPGAPELASDFDESVTPLEDLLRSANPATARDAADRLEAAAVALGLTVSPGPGAAEAAAGAGEGGGEEADPTVPGADDDRAACGTRPAWLAAQERDPQLADLRRAVLAGTAGKSSLYRIEDDGLLVHPMAAGRRALPVCPDALVDSVLSLAHTELTGHAGARALARVAGAMCHMPNLRERARAFVAGCDACQRFRSPAQRPLVMGGSASVYSVSYPTQVLYMDFVAAPRSREGFDASLTLLDGFSGWVEFTPTRGKSGDETVRALDDFAYRYGRPRVIVCDNDPAFGSLAVRDWCHLNGVRLAPVTAYLPRANFAERSHQVLQRVRRHAVLADPARASFWVADLRRAALVHNTAVNEGHGLTPFELFYGREPPAGHPTVPVPHEAAEPIPSVVAAPSPAPGPESPAEVAAERDALRAAVTHLRAQREATMTANLARLDLGEARQERSRRAHRGAGWATLHPGDLVLHRSQLLLGKLEPKWQGPFRVLTKLADSTYWIRAVEGAFGPLRNRGTFKEHISNLKPYSAREFRVGRDGTAVPAARGRDDDDEDVAFVGEPSDWAEGNAGPPALPPEGGGPGPPPARPTAPVVSRPGAASPAEPAPEGPAREPLPPPRTQPPRSNTAVHRLLDGTANYWR